MSREWKLERESEKEMCSPSLSFVPYVAFLI